MTVFTFSGGENFSSFKVSGHAMYSDYGSDIVCAAVSAVVTMLELSFAEILGEERGSFILNETSDDVEISYSDPSDLTPQEKDMLGKVKCAFYKYVSALRENYKENILIVKRR